MPLARSQACLLEFSCLILTVTLRGKTFLISTFSVKKLRHRAIGWLTQGYTARECWVSRQLCLTPVLILYCLLPSLLHPSFLRHSWDGGENKPRAALGKSTPAKGQKPKPVLRGTQLCVLKVAVSCKCRGTIHILTVLKWV